MENYERFEQLLQQFSFKELSEEDQRIAMSFINSEEEYESLRHADQQLVSHLKRKVDFDSTDQVWKRIKKYRVASRTEEIHYSWMKTPLPAYAAFLLIIVVGSVCWWGGSSYGISQVSISKAPQLRVDTVFIASKPDTVVKEKIVYVNRQIIPPSVAVQTSVKANPESVITRGVSMKEKEELEKLLVSGSI